MARAEDRVVYLRKVRLPDGEIHWTWANDLDGLRGGGLLDGGLDDWLSADDPEAWLRKQATDRPVPPGAATLAPVDTQEIWAAGVTYERSRVARMEESAGGGDFYDKVYTADRPELFLKAPGWRAVGTGAGIGLRTDSCWDVPEPEWTVVANHRGEIVGSTIGNDVSSRSIEGENPLYLPQAKVFDRSCAIGPAIKVHGDPGRPELSIHLEIERAGLVVFEGDTSTARMRRSALELVRWLTRSLSFPMGVLLMTGTGLVPPDSFTLRTADRVRIGIQGLGTLENSVA